MKIDKNSQWHIVQVIQHIQHEVAIPTITPYQPPNKLFVNSLWHYPIVLLHFLSIYFVCWAEIHISAVGLPEVGILTYSVAADCKVDIYYLHMAGDIANDIANDGCVPEREPTHDTGHIDADNYYERRLSVTSQRKPAFPAISHTRRLEEMCATAALGTTSQSTLFPVTEQSVIHRPHVMHSSLALTTVHFTSVLRFCTFLWLRLLYLF